MVASRILKDGADCAMETLPVFTLNKSNLTTLFYCRVKQMSSLSFYAIRYLLSAISRELSAICHLLRASLLPALSLTQRHVLLILTHPLQKFRTETSIILMTHSSLLIVSLCFLSLAFLVSPTFGAQPTLEPILLGYPSPALTELPNYLAVKKGFYTEEGLDIKFVRARSNILVAALVGGSLDYITSVTSSVGGIIGGAPVKILAGVIKNNP